MLFRLLDWIKQYRLDMVKARAEAEHYQLRLITEAMTENTNVIKAWFSNFTTTEVPSSSIVRDEDAFAQEQDELHPGIRQSIENGVRAGAFPEILDLLKER